MLKIKGINNNLIFIFEKSGTYKEYRTLLENKFKSNEQLFNGSRVIFKGEGLNFLSHEQIASLQKLCLEHGMILNNSGINIDRTQSKDTIIYKNLRSGQKIRSEGSVTVWGNVHESAEIIAAQDIIVLGKLEGIAHAGFYGDLNSVVFALNLSPSQIRIGDKISRSPKDDIKSPYPEIAYLENNIICIKKYRPTDKLARLKII